MRDTDLTVFCNLPEIETERLLLRKMLPSDADDMYAYSCRPETSEYLLWSPHAAPSVTKKYLAFLQKQYKAAAFYDFAVVEKATGRMIGTCGFSSFDLDNNSAEIGYVLSPDYWGRGMATEAVRKILTFGFLDLSLHRICVRILDGNTASIRVAEKCGMRHEATHIHALRVKGEYKTFHEYAILSREWMK